MMDIAMQSQGVTSELTPRTNSTKDFQLNIVQQPIEARIPPGAALRLKNGKWPIDPPPVLELTSSEMDPEKWMYIHNPNWFCSASLAVIEIDPNRSTTTDAAKVNMTGQLVSSLHKVKSPEDKKEHGYFAFGDLNILAAGKYRLKFTLFEIRRCPGSSDTYAVEVHTVTSDIFSVHSNRQNGHPASSSLSKSLVEAGVKIRIRKEATKRRQVPIDWSSTPANSLNRTQNIHLAPIVHTQVMAPPRSRYARNMGIDVTNRLTTRDEPLTPAVETRSQPSPSEMDSFTRQSTQPPTMNGRGGHTPWEVGSSQYTSSPAALSQDQAYEANQNHFSYSMSPAQEAWVGRNNGGIVAQSPDRTMVIQTRQDTGRDQPLSKRSRDSGYGQSIPNPNFFPQASISQAPEDPGYSSYHQGPSAPMHDMPGQMHQFPSVSYAPESVPYPQYPRQDGIPPGTYPSGPQTGITYSPAPYNEMPPGTYPPATPDFSFNPPHQYAAGGPGYYHAQ